MNFSSKKRCISILSPYYKIITGRHEIPLVQSSVIFIGSFVDNIFEKHNTSSSTNINHALYCFKRRIGMIKCIS